MDTDQLVIGQVAFGETLRSYSGSGGSVIATWDGTDATGTIVADETYTATLFRV